MEIGSGFCLIILIKVCSVFSFSYFLKIYLYWCENDVCNLLDSV